MLSHIVVTQDFGCVYCRRCGVVSQLLVKLPAALSDVAKVLEIVNRDMAEQHKDCPELPKTIMITRDEDVLRCNVVARVEMGYDVNELLPHLLPPSNKAAQAIASYDRLIVDARPVGTVGRSTRRLVIRDPGPDGYNG